MRIKNTMFQGLIVALFVSVIVVGCSLEGPTPTDNLQQEEESQTEETLGELWYQDSQTSHFAGKIRSVSENKCEIALTHIVLSDSLGYEFDYTEGNFVSIYFDEAYDGDTLITSENPESIHRYLFVEFDASCVKETDKFGNVTVSRIQCSGEKYDGDYIKPSKRTATVLDVDGDRLQVSLNYNWYTDAYGWDLSYQKGDIIELECSDTYRLMGGASKEPGEISVGDTVTIDTAALTKIEEEVLHFSELRGDVFYLSELQFSSLQ